MNIKYLVMTLLLSLLLIGLAGVRLTAEAPASDVTESNIHQNTQAEEALELVWSFEVRIRLPILKKDAI